MHNLYKGSTIFHNLIQPLACWLVNEKGNIPRCGVVPSFSDCTILGDKGYLSATVQVDLFMSCNIRL